jgi:hypothetical protein
MPLIHEPINTLAQAMPSGTATARMELNRRYHAVSLQCFAQEQPCLAASRADPPPRSGQTRYIRPPPGHNPRSGVYSGAGKIMNHYWHAYGPYRTV